MPRNLVPNHFDKAGIYVEGERSAFRFNKPVLASFMSGMLVPLGDPIPVFPGVKFDLAIDAVIRSNTMVVPPLDGMYVDFFTVWVPHRIVWNHFPQFLGDNDTTAWTQSNNYVYPYVDLQDLLVYNGGNDLCVGLYNDSNDLSVSLGNFSIVDHYGLFNNDVFESIVNGTPLPATTLRINVLAFRGYYSLWNYLFRDENYQRPVLFSKGDTGSSGEFGYLLRDYLITSSDHLTTEMSVSLGQGLHVGQAMLMPVNKLHDAITSGLPQPQFGNEVQVPLGTTAPVFYEAINGSNIPVGANHTYTVNSTSLAILKSSAFSLNSSGNHTGNLVADLSATSAAASINKFRSSVMYQRYLEALARSGRRPVEYMSAVYGVSNTSAKCDYPDLVTRARYALGVNQVVATADGSGSGWTSHLGDTGAYSLTVLKNVPCCERDFTEFGYLHICYCVRADNRYSQLIQPHFLKDTLLSEYNPFFDHIGDVGLQNVMVNSSAQTFGVFSYQEAWFDERTQFSMATGALNKQYGSLKHWVLGEVFDSSLTACSPSFLTFDPAVLDDIFVSTYYVYPQFIMDARIHGKKVARMSQHSIPGIVGRI